MKKALISLFFLVAPLATFGLSYDAGGGGPLSRDGTNSTSVPVAISRTSGYTSGLDAVFNITWTVDPGATGVAAGFTSVVTATGTSAASGGHTIAGLGRVFANSGYLQNAIGLEGRCDTDSAASGHVCIGVLGLGVWDAAGASVSEIIGLQSKVQAFTGDTATPASTATLVQLDLVTPTGGGDWRGIRQSGGLGYNWFSSSVTFGATQAAPTLAARVQITQASGGGVVPALGLLGGASGDVYMGFGQTSPLNGIIVSPGTAGNFFTGSLAGDLGMQMVNTANNICLAVGLNAGCEVLISNNAVKFLGADNGTVIVSSIPATQANCTTADTFMQFNSNTGAEGSIACTAVAGVLAYNTFTGAHWTRVDIKKPEDYVLFLVESTGKSLRMIDGKAVIEEGERGLVMKEQLVRGRLCRTRGSKSIMGFYAGRNERDGKDSVLALGTGLAWVANKGMDVDNGDLLMSSDVEGAVEIQDANFATPETERDDVVKSITVAKARQPIRWKAGEKKRKIAVVYTCG